MIITIAIIIVGVLLYVYVFGRIANAVHRKALKAELEADAEAFYRNHPEERELDDDAGDYIEWKHKFHYEHKGIRVFNIPFVPERNEVFYMENAYNEAANLFIRENMQLIRDMLAEKGLTFVYLPEVRVSEDMARAMVRYMSPGDNSAFCIQDSALSEPFHGGGGNGLKSDFLLDYMVTPENRPNVTFGFCWYNSTRYFFSEKKGVHYFDYISFDTNVARERPREFLEDILHGLGKSKAWQEGVYCKVKGESHGTADDNFDEETRNVLEEIQEKLNAVRLKGISEAIIAEYVKPCPKLSRMTIGGDFRITLNDYGDMEITMEPIVKAVFLLFLRHEEGIFFKELSDYQRELEIIYRAVKERRNDIDERLASGFMPQISPGVRSLTDPTKNSINEKCTRIKEAFITRFHENVARNYYVCGLRASAKRIDLPRKLVEWME